MAEPAGTIGRSRPMLHAAERKQAKVLLSSKFSSCPSPSDVLTSCRADLQTDWGSSWPGASLLQAMLSPGKPVQCTQTNTHMHLLVCTEYMPRNARPFEGPPAAHHRRGGIVLQRAACCAGGGELLSLILARRGAAAPTSPTTWPANRLDQGLDRSSAKR